MNYFDKSRALITMIVVLVVLNLGTLAFLWTSRPPNGPPGGHPGGQAGEFLSAQVGFTPDQRDQYRLLRDEHRRLSRSIEDSLHYYKEHLFGFLPQANTAGAQQTAEHIGQLQIQLEVNTFQHFSEVRKLCTDEQKTKFDDVIQEVLRMMAPPKR